MLSWEMVGRWLSEAGFSWVRKDVLDGWSSRTEEMGCYEREKGIDVFYKLEGVQISLFIAI